MILRDVWLGWILSVLFEIMEYSLEHQLPNFAECAWDHVRLSSFVSVVVIALYCLFGFQMFCLSVFCFVLFFVTFLTVDP